MCRSPAPVTALFPPVRGNFPINAGECSMLRMKAGNQVLLSQAVNVKARGLEKKPGGRKAGLLCKTNTKEVDTCAAYLAAYVPLAGDAAPAGIRLVFNAWPSCPWKNTQANTG
jgi:hypothetical protein